MENKETQPEVKILNQHINIDLVKESKAWNHNFDKHSREISEGILNDNNVLSYIQKYVIDRKVLGYIEEKFANNKALCKNNDSQDLKLQKYDNVVNQYIEEINELKNTNIELEQEINDLFHTNCKLVNNFEFINKKLNRTFLEKIENLIEKYF